MMPIDMLKNEIEKAGLRDGFNAVDTKLFLTVIEKVGADESITNGSFHRLLESLLKPFVFPATWQKLSEFGWADEEIAGLMEAKLVKEAPTTLTTAISLGALSIQEYDEYISYPNQEIDILYYTQQTQKILGWLNSKSTLPKISKDAFAL